jgi:hypothetical protein
MWPTILKDLLSRKWLAFMLVEWLSFWGLMTDKVSGAEWEVISLAALGLFAGSNVYQKIKAGPAPRQQ